MSNEYKKYMDKKNDKFNQLCVLEGTLFPEGGVKEFHKFFKDEMGVRVKFENQVKTLPDFEGCTETGGKDQFVKGINQDGQERYFALSFVESVTDYFKYLDR